MATKKATKPPRVVIRVVRGGAGVSLIASLRTLTGNKAVKAKGAQGGLYELQTAPHDSLDETIKRGKELAKLHGCDPVAVEVPRFLLGVR